jgi:putative acetyltransferase
LDVHIRSEKIDDYKEIREVNILAFNREDEAKLIEAIRESAYFVPELSLVAVTDEHEIVGHILFSGITLETDKGNLPTLALAPMAVKPQYQRQGIGSRLVTEGLKICRILGYQHVFVMGHPNFYQRFGFVPASSYGIKSPFPVPDEVFMALELMDKSLDGWTGKIKYPKAFDAVS